MIAQQANFRRASDGRTHASLGLSESGRWWTLAIVRPNTIDRQRVTRATDFETAGMDVVVPADAIAKANTLLTAAGLNMRFDS